MTFSTHRFSVSNDLSATEGLEGPERSVCTGAACRRSFWVAAGRPEDHAALGLCGASAWGTPATSLLTSVLWMTL